MPQRVAVAASRGCSVVGALRLWVRLSVEVVDASVADAVSPLPCLDVSHVSRVGRSPPLARQVIFFYPLRQIGKAS